MYRLRLSTPLVLFVSTLITLAVPMPAPMPSSQNGTVADLEKRITHVGRGTWFHPGKGHCGQWNTDQDPIVAISLAFYNQNNGGNCGQWMQIVNTANGKSAFAYVHDSCEVCPYYGLDMSPAVFAQLAPLDVGVIQVSWNFKPKGWYP